MVCHKASVEEDVTSDQILSDFDMAVFLGLNFSLAFTVKFEIEFCLISHYVQRENRLILAG